MGKIEIDKIILHTCLFESPHRIGCRVDAQIRRTGMGGGALGLDTQTILQYGNGRGGKRCLGKSDFQLDRVHAGEGNFRYAMAADRIRHKTTIHG